MCKCGWVKIRIVTYEKFLFWCEKGYEGMSELGHWIAAKCTTDWAELRQKFRFLGQSCAKHSKQNREMQ